MINSLDTISSQVKKDGLVNLKAPTDNFLVQDSRKNLVNNKALQLGGKKKAEVTQKDL